MELLNNLGINGKLLLAQIVNFLVLLFVLYKFAYGPVLKILNERTEKIEKGLKDSENAHKKLLEMTEKEKALLARARKEAREIMARGEYVAKKSKEEIISNAKSQSEKILSEAEKKIEMEKIQMMDDVKKQVASLVVSAAGKIIDAKFDPEKDKAIINKAIGEA